MNIMNNFIFTTIDSHTFEILLSNNSIFFFFQNKPFVIWNDDSKFFIFLINEYYNFSIETSDSSKFPFRFEFFLRIEWNKKDTTIRREEEKFQWENKGFHEVAGRPKEALESFLRRKPGFQDNGLNSCKQKVPIISGVFGGSKTNA